ncbi:unnamed protein product [Protopolystoma xenopodis]|uniref:Uncharacterized protein n=1 Tax=Protopolystoma xenopodis TaxID=117903 RepID=A0A3S5B5C3_9PLAT|nr:unnamed protein product [Protopolystoma xenopodis]
MPPTLVPASAPAQMQPVSAISADHQVRLSTCSGLSVGQSVPASVAISPFNRLGSRRPTGFGMGLASKSGSGSGSRLGSGSESGSRSGSGSRSRWKLGPQSSGSESADWQVSIGHEVVGPPGQPAEQPASRREWAVSSIIALSTRECVLLSVSTDRLRLTRETRPRRDAPRTGLAIANCA